MTLIVEYDNITLCKSVERVITIGGVSFGARNTIKGITNEIDSINEFNLDIELKMMQIKNIIKEQKEEYWKELKLEPDYDPLKDEEYEKQWNDYEKYLLEYVDEKVRELKNRNATVHVVAIIIKLIIGIGVIGIFYAISH